MKQTLLISATTNFSNKCLNRPHITFAQFEDQPAMAVLLDDVHKAAPNLKADNEYTYTPKCSAANSSRGGTGDASPFQVLHRSLCCSSSVKEL